MNKPLVVGNVYILSPIANKRMENLDKILIEFRENYRRNIEFDNQDNLFFEIIDGERKQVRFKTTTQEPNQEDELQKLYDSSEGNPIHNSTYEANLTPADKSLRRIIVDQVKRVVGQQLDDQGYMELREGKLRPTHGSCHLFWRNTKQILKDKYNIDWASPQDENPLTLYS